MDEGIVAAVSISERKGAKKKNVPFAELKDGFGLIGDAHAGPSHRQISLRAGFKRGSCKKRR